MSQIIALSQEELVLDAVSSLTCLLCVRQRPCARKGARRHLRTRINAVICELLNNGVPGHVRRMFIRQQVHLCCIAHKTKLRYRLMPPVLQRPQNKKMRYGRAGTASNIIEAGFG